MWIHFPIDRQATDGGISTALPPIKCGWYVSSRFLVSYEYESGEGLRPGVDGVDGGLRSETSESIVHSYTSCSLWLACLINCSTPYAPCIDHDPSKKSTVRLFVAKVLGAPCL
ncbi:hypothetical protein PCH_Pc16g12490 [Penicillium rubens Wisconsin 54-1255]|uniref:Uncharacterized protein n=1 Tax=Penicillium rubens (strain ATCC 28089 / DSM 1075 / NRRL 1951 / Wisconsin 54-1255) TaxID=500485 RepID=B6HAE0_PENRW|nr:hypothetical protein PCH_Pc16g12490 [Penicillium rubens Wisconsin 54-1255]